MITNEIKYIVKGRDEILILFNDENKGTVYQERNIFNIELIRLLKDLGTRLIDDNIRDVIKRKDCDHIELVRIMDHNYDIFHMISISLKRHTMKLDTVDGSFSANKYDYPGYYDAVSKQLEQLKI